ncbi:MAG: PIG-L family deacetylase, partial [Kyrpidia sp.]|nr:PIG-L family deacetylase [Kyrpidia sp.]
MAHRFRSIGGLAAWTLAGAMILALAWVGAVWLAPYWWDLLHPAAPPPEVDERDFGDRILFIAPHPDDESLGGGGLIQRSAARGKRVDVVFMTAGDGYRRAAEEAFHVFPASAADLRRLGELRHSEALAALSELGVPPDHVWFFGFADGGLAPMWDEYWSNDRPFQGLNGATSPPYGFAFQAYRPYSGAAVVAKLTAVIRQLRPTDIVYPDPFDQHPDHWATSAFVTYTLAGLNPAVQQWTYLVHRGDYPVPWAYRPGRTLVPPEPLVTTGVRWLAFALHQHEEERKYAAIARHVSQVRVIGPFLRAFVRRNELFGQFDVPVQPAASDFVPGRAHSPPSTAGRSGAGVPLAPFTVVRDAVGDTLHREWEGAADIRAVASVCTNDRWYIGIQTREPVARGTVYDIHLRL